MIKVGIANGTHGEVHIHKPDKRDPYGGGPPGLVVYNREGQKGSQTQLFFSNPTYGIELNQNVSFTGSTVNIHNGLDSTEWTASVLAGVANHWDFNSSVQASTGSFSVEATGVKDGDSVLFTAATPISSSDFQAFSSDIYLTSFGLESDDIFVRCRLGGVDVGNSVALSSFIQRNSFNIWQPFIMDKSLFGITNEMIDEFVILVQGVPDFYMDALRFVSGGSSIAYTIEPPKGMIFMLSALELLFVGPHDSRLADATIPNIPTDGFLNISRLANGITLNRIQRDRRQPIDVVLRGMDDLFSFPNADMPAIFGDASSTLVKVRVKVEPHNPLDSRTGDFGEIRINDDLSALTRFRWVAYGYLVKIIDGEFDPDPYVPL